MHVSQGEGLDQTLHPICIALPQRIGGKQRKRDLTRRRAVTIQTARREVSGDGESGIC